MQSMNVFTVLQSMQVAGQNLSLKVFGSTTQIQTQTSYMDRFSEPMLYRTFQYVMTPPPNDRTEMGPRNLYDTPVFSAGHPCSPFGLSQVCRRWRHIVHNSPSVWESIAINRPSKRLIRRVEIWMQCAKGRLNIDFFQSPPESPDDMEAATEIIDVLCKNHKIWSQVRFHLHQGYFPPSLASSLHLISTLASPMLKSVIISNSYNFVASEQAVVLAWKSLNKIPSLRTIQWRSEDRLFRPAHCLLQCLTSLTLQGITALELIRGVKTCVNLRELQAAIHDANINYDNLQYVQPDTHRLEHLSLTAEPGDIQAFLHSFTLPKLLSVELTYVDTVTSQFLWRLLQRSNAYLQRLLLQIWNVDAETLISWFDITYLHGLETFSITGGQITDATLLKLTVFPRAENKHHYFQFLRNLVMSTGNADINEDIFIRMLASRLFTANGEPYKVELANVTFVVHTKTQQMRMYEDMCRSLINATYKQWVNSMGWNHRTVCIRQA